MNENVTCAVCQPLSQKANGYCSEHSTTGSEYAAVKRKWNRKYDIPMRRTKAVFYNVLAHVVSFDLSEALKKAGFRQDTVFSWYQSDAKNPTQPLPKGTVNVVSRPEICAAPLLTEILEQMPDSIRTPDEAAIRWLSLNNQDDD